MKHYKRGDEVKYYRHMAFIFLVILKMAKSVLVKRTTRNINNFPFPKILKTGKKG